MEDSWCEVCDREIGAGEPTVQAVQRIDVTAVEDETHRYVESEPVLIHERCVNRKGWRRA